MPLTAPNGETDLIAVDVFPNKGGGFGYGITKERQYPEGYERTLNTSVRDGDVLSPAFLSDPASDSARSSRSPWSAAWQTADAEPLPMFLEGSRATVSRRIDGFSGVTNVQIAGDAYENFSQAFHDNGNGTEYCYVGKDLDNSYLARMTQAGVWTLASGAGQLVRAKYIVSAAGALWRTTSDYQVSKCPAGSEPFTLISWGANIQVGTNYGKITALGALGAVPIVFRTDGIYAYNEADNRFENQFPVDPHQWNFLFAKPDGMGGLYSAMHDGSIVHIGRFGPISVMHPLAGKMPERDTPRGAITDIAIWGDRIFAYMAAAYRLVQPPGMKVMKTADNYATFTDYSAQAIDTQQSTVVDISSLPSGVGGAHLGYLLIGFDQPFLAVQFLMSSFNTTGSTTAQLFFQISTGAGTWAIPTNLSADIQDYSGRFFGHSGIVSISEASSIATWAPATYNGFTKYWLAISSDTALPSTVTISAIAIVVKRPAPAFGVTNHPQAAVWEASGMLSKVLMGTFKGSGIVWDDLYTLRDQSPAGHVVVTTLPLSNSPAGSLVAGGAQFPLPNLLDTAVVEYPSLARDISGKLAPIFYPSAVDLGAVHTLRYVEIFGADLVEGVDSWNVAWRWDSRNAWEVTTAQQTTNALFAIEDHVGGSVLHMAIQLLDANNTDAVGPTGRRIRCWLKEMPVRPSGQVEPVRAALEVS